MAEGRVEANRTVKKRDQLAGDGESQPHPVDTLRTGQPGESVVDPAALLLRHAAARVSYGQHETAGSDIGRDGDAPRIGIFDGVADEIFRYLTYAESIAETRRRHCRGAAVHDRKPLFLGPQSEALHAVGHQLRRREADGAHLHPPLFQPVIVE